MPSYLSTKLLFHSGITVVIPPRCSQSDSDLNVKEEDVQQLDDDAERVKQMRIKNRKCISLIILAKFEFAFLQEQINLPSFSNM